MVYTHNIYPTELVYGYLMYSYFTVSTGMEVVDVKDPKLTIDDTGLMEVYRPHMSRYVVQCDLYEGSGMICSCC